jgi:hypothetical protein
MQLPRPLPLAEEGRLLHEAHLEYAEPQRLQVLIRLRRLKSPVGEGHHLLEVHLDLVEILHHQAAIELKLLVVAGHQVLQLGEVLLLLQEEVVVALQLLQPEVEPQPRQAVEASQHQRVAVEPQQAVEPWAVAPLDAVARVVVELAADRSRQSPRSN